MSNRLLALLPPDSRAHLMSKLTRVPLRVPQILIRANEQADAAYFPESGWISVVINLSDGRSAEVGLVGREGVVGTARGWIGTADHMVQGNGEALRIEIAALENELTQNEGLRLILDVYAQAVYVQTAHIAACNGWHDLQSRFARWLLLARDRADSDELPLTQEFLAMMLCVHRPRITVIAGILQTAGIITYNRGHIIIRNREALEATACECYGIMREQFEQVFRRD